MEQKQTCECGASLTFVVDIARVDRYGHRRRIYHTDCPACGATAMFDFREV